MNLVRLPTPSGAETVEADGILLHSRYDPRKEAARVAAEAAAATHVVVLAPGLGYVPAALAGRRLLLVERHAALDALARERALPGADADGSVRLVAPTPEEVRDRVLDWEGVESGHVAVLTGTTLPSDAGYYDAIRSAVVRAIEQRAEELATVRGFAGTWERNLATNASWIAAANGTPSSAGPRPPRRLRLAAPGDADVRWLDVEALGWRGRVVAVLAAGPSLVDDLPALAEACDARPGRDGAALRPPVVLAVDSALPATLAAGLAPDAVATIDPQPVKASCLDALGGIPLIASVLSPPEVLARAERLRLFGQGHPGEADAGVPPRAVFREIGGSVATAAVAVAVAAGASALLLIGQDLAVADAGDPSAAARMPVTHAGGTHFERRVLEDLGRFSGGARSVLRRRAPSNLRRVPAVDGGTVATTPVLDGYRHWLREFAASRRDVLFIQTSRRGAAIGIPARPILEALQMASGAVDRSGSA